MSYILFYSNKCPHSAKFIRFLEDSGEAVFFNKICVDRDRSGNRTRLINKYDVKEVPSIIVDDKLLSDLPAFSWLSKRIQNSGNSVNSIPSRNNKLSNLQSNPDDSRVTLEAYDSGGITNFTNNCVSIDDADNFKYSKDSVISCIEDNSKEVPKETNFRMVNDSFTGQDEGGKSFSKNDTLKNKQFDNAYNKMMKERDNDNPKRIHN